jgi:molybdopterin converting factor small subunit
MKIAVTIPTMLRDAVGGSQTIAVEAVRLIDALERLRRDFPLLRPHLWDDAGRPRQHVLIFYNDTALRWLDSLDVILQPGDRLTIVQAVSGG